MNRSVSLRSVFVLALVGSSLATMVVGCAAETQEEAASAETALNGNDDDIRACTQPAMQKAFYWANEGLANARMFQDAGESYRACVQQAELAINNIQVAVAIKEERKQCDTPELWAAPSVDPNPVQRAAVAFKNARANLQRASNGRGGYKRVAIDQLTYAIRLCAGRDI